jgi:nucleoside-diphosphate-sugar epimerase
VTGPLHTIAITGATGFVGGYLAHYFHTKGHRVLAFGRRPDAQLPPAICYRSWDITQPYPFDAEEKLSAVVHCAGTVSEWGTYDEMYRSNVLGTENALSAFAGADLFVHISSASVYGTKGRKIMVREDEPYPATYLNHYSTSKMLGEMAVKASAHPNRAILRPHIIYGPGDTTLLPRMRRARRAGFFIVLGNGHNVLSLTHVANLAQAVDLLIGRQWGLEIFNVCDSRTDTLNQILTTLIETMRWHDRLVHINPSIARGAGTLLERTYNTLRLSSSPILTPYVVDQITHDFTMDTEKAHTMLGYTPQLEYPQGFREVYDWLTTERDDQHIGNRIEL